MTEQAQVVQDPSINQRIASDPNVSAWVKASAGTGKTKVLVDRFLRLMLPRQHENGDIEPGTPPDRILCLTYTKAAAGNMKTRIQKKLSLWAICPREELEQEIFDLIQQRPNDEMCRAARQLFATVVDRAGELKIMTIHAFSQSLLARFPLEAGLAPNFETADERMAKELKTQALDNMLGRDQSDQMKEALETLLDLSSYTTFESILRHAVNKSGQVRRYLNHHQTLDGAIDAIYKLLNISPKTDIESVYQPLIRQTISSENSLKELREAISSVGKTTDQKNLDPLNRWLNDQTFATLDDLIALLLTKGGTIHSRFPTKNVMEAAPQAYEIWKELAQLGFEARQAEIRLESARISRAVLILSNAYLEAYEAVKRQQSVLDYDDQIAIARSLLHQPGISQWILYKIDGGIDHVLVDEAQDTDPTMWDIIKALTNDFFSGEGKREIERTVFSVGDMKQSIYSFKGAEPQEFLNMERYYEERVTATNQIWCSVDMRVNFRSSSMILDSVDQVFNPDYIRKATGEADEIKHDTFSNHSGYPGSIEVWPVIYKPKQEQVQANPIESLPDQNYSPNDPISSLCNRVAQQIKSWRVDGKTLKRLGRPIRPGDIMILVRRRHPFMAPMIKALKSHGIPVAGADRMVLKEQLVVQDLIGLCEFVLNPERDLNLAEILSSPIIGFDQDQLYQACHEREAGQSVWRHLLGLEQGAYKIASDYLKDLEDKAAYQSPYEFLQSVLDTPCPTSGISLRHAFIARLGYDVLDPMSELLTQARQFSQTHSPHLQSFVNWVNSGDSEVKRELSDDSSLDEVRIMTVHGSKGLESPIVFLLDDLKHPRKPNSGESFAWSNNEAEPFLWAPSSKIGKADIVEERYDQAHAVQLNEYIRLLYVAMTRAKDNFIMCAADNTQLPDQPRSTDLDSENLPIWYDLVRSQLSEHSEASNKPFNCDPELIGDQTLLSLHRSGSAETKQSQNPAHPSVGETDPRSQKWLFETAKEEGDPTRPLRPSKPIDVAVQSPLTRQDDAPFRRGQVIHALLQNLPDLPAEKWQQVIDQYLNQPGITLPESHHPYIKQEIISLLENSNFAPVFGLNSRAEVPLTGVVRLKGKPYTISGQVDRLAITDEAVLVVDYKTNRDAPKNVEDVPEGYIQQMAAYRALLKTIYPQHEIQCALLWTSSANLMALPNELLDSAG